LEKVFVQTKCLKKIFDWFGIECQKISGGTIALWKLQI